MYATGHPEAAGSLSTMAETLGEEVLTSQDTIDWNSGKFVTTSWDRHTLSFRIRSRSKVSHDFRKQW